MVSFYFTSTRQQKSSDGFKNLQKRAKESSEFIIYILLYTLSKSTILCLHFYTITILLWIIFEIRRKSAVKFNYE